MFEIRAVKRGEECGLSAIRRKDLKADASLNPGAVYCAERIAGWSVSGELIGQPHFGTCRLLRNHRG